MKTPSNTRLILVILGGVYVQYITTILWLFIYMWLIFLGFVLNFRLEPRSTVPTFGLFLWIASQRGIVYWIARQAEQYAQGRQVVFRVVLGAGIVITFFIGILNWVFGPFGIGSFEVM